MWVHPVELVVCFEVVSLKLRARCHGLPCDLDCCIVMMLVVNVGCCPAELCSDCSASGHGPSWMRVSCFFIALVCLGMQCFSGGSPMNMPLVDDQLCLQWPYVLLLLGFHFCFGMHLRWRHL
ncbi:hypothetical protein Nepgr_021453 [Nepenthes gracilis]|uniref:Uncharacterized protein n=1 Tax=Nepenthes gracilis TaxID=150966 RepID=A0AAD3SYT5_NEPGR|nr:hypothetical protein Nepgr_021453 [Nepenthes gracilis]